MRSGPPSLLQENRRGRRAPATAAPPGSKPLGARRRENAGKDRLKLQGAVALLPLSPVEETEQAAANRWRKAPNEPGVAHLQTSTLTTSTMEAGRVGGKKAAAHHLLHRGDADLESMKRRSPNPPRPHGRPGKKSSQIHHRATELPRHHGRTRGSAAASRKEPPPAPRPFIGRLPTMTCLYSDLRSRGERSPSAGIDLGRRSMAPPTQGAARLKPKLENLSYSDTFPPPPPAAMAAGGAQDRAVSQELGAVTVEGSGGERGKWLPTLLWCFQLALWMHQC
jgi:hypothetical protein